ncbi:MAG: hypothetical protein HYV07_28600 [Deltaproteobacteria bacterium]|nr:hypothetical protein [Deltaproteobacteria bacterium]
MIRTAVALAFIACLACGEPREPTRSEDAAVPVDSGPLADAGASLCPVTCASFDLAGTTYDPSSHVLSIAVLVSAPAIRSGSISFQTSKGSGLSMHAAVLTVVDRTMSVDLSAVLTADVVFFGAISLTLVADCGATSSVANLVPHTEAGGSGITVREFSCG